MKTTCTRMQQGLCVRCNKAPAYMVVLKLCDSCFAELNKIKAPKDEHNAAEWNEYSKLRRVFLAERI